MTKAKVPGALVYSLATVVGSEECEQTATAAALSLICRQSWRPPWPPPTATATTAQRTVFTARAT